jgi:flagellar hook-associated protein 3 FlgL
MSVDAIGTAATAQFMLAQIQKAELALDTSNRQVATGKVSDTYTGYADKTAMMEAARSVGALADANAAAAQQASTQLDLQDTQLSQLSQLANSVRQTLTSAAANQDGTSLMTQMQGYFDQAVGILNSQDANGAYVYGGDKNQTPPVSVTSLSALAALPSAAQAFANGSLKSSVRVGTTQSVQVGLLASDLGTQLFSLFQQVAQFDAGGSGPFNAATTPAQQNFLESTIQTSANAASDVNQQAAGNGMRYQMVQGTLTQLQATSTLYKGMVSDIEDVDMAHALAQLSQNQVALQASFQVTSKLNQLSLLNYLPPA